MNCTTRCGEKCDYGLEVYIVFSETGNLSIYSKNGNVKIEDVVFINGTVTGVNSLDVQGIDDESTLLNMVGSTNQYGRIFQIQSTPGMSQPDIFMSGGGGSDRARGHITVGYARMEVLGKLTVDETIKMETDGDQVFCSSTG